MKPPSASIACASTVAQRPLALAEHRHRRLEEPVVGDGDRVVEVEAREVGAKPSRPQRERSLGVGVAPEVVVPCLRFLVGAAGDDGRAQEHLDVVACPTLLHGLTTYAFDDLLHAGLALPVEENAFGVCCRKA